MKILHLSSEYPPAKVYGLGRFIHGLARAQATLGDEVIVATNSTGGGEDDVTKDGVRLHRIAFPNPPRPPEGHGEVLQFNHGLVARLLERRVNIGKVDVVASHDWLTAVAAREVARALGAPLVVTFHDEVVGKRFGAVQGTEVFVRDLEALTAHDATRVIANSRFIGEQVVRYYGVPRDRVTAIPGGIDPGVAAVASEKHVATFRSALVEEGDVLVAYVGRLDQEKGLDVLARAALEAGRSGERLVFVLAGTGREEASLRSSLGPLGPRARLLGYVKDAALAHLYRAADVVVVPSLYEPFGLVALEAMLAGAATIVSGAGGLAEIVRAGEDGVVVPPGDAPALGEAILRLADDATLRERLGAAAARRARGEFSWHEIARRTREVYEAAVPAPRPVCEAAPVLPARTPVTIELAEGSDSTIEALVARTDYRPLDVRVGTGPGHELVCRVPDGVTIAEGNEGWLSGLVWTLETLGAASVSPSTSAELTAPRRADRAEGACLLARRGGLERGAHWVHPCVVSRTSFPVSIVLVAWNGLELTREAVEAVLAHTSPPFELVLVDNGSTDGTRDYLRSLRDRAPVKVIENADNRGYPIAANQGLRAARGRDVVLLNNDTRVRPGWLDALLDARRSDPRVGIVTAKILNLDGTVQSAGGILHDPDGTFRIDHQGEDRLAPAVTQRRDVENAGGPCLLLTRELIERVGVFDEVYSPAYFEDSDLCLRAREAGFTLVYEPRAEVVHHGKATSSAVAREGKLDVWGRFEANKRRFHERWRNRLEADRREREATERAAGIGRKRVLLCYGRDPVTTASYCEAALRRGHDVVVAGPGQEVDPGEGASVDDVVAAAGGRFDLLLAVEGATWVPRDLERAPCPTAWWAIDVHIHAAREEPGYLALAREFDHVFIAQRDYAPLFAHHGVATTWLPLACDPQVHRRHELPRELDVVFLGNVLPIHRRRRALLDRLRRRFGPRLGEFHGLYRDDMAALYSRARIVFNASLAGDLNMRVFEALSTGSLLVTDRIPNGQDDLFADREHLVLYDDANVEQVVETWLGDDARRDEIARRGQALVTRHHTYAHRMDAVLRHVATTKARARPATEEARS